MLFNKYQYNHSSINKRGYSLTSVASDSSGEPTHWVKWILGIEKNSTKSRILADKLRHLQKARNTVLPEIVEYGYDTEQGTFAIVYENVVSSKTLEENYRSLSFQSFLRGVISVAECLNELHLKNIIAHGDISPANILVDNNEQFYLIDFGITDIANTLSQEREIEVFAGRFAAPEKKTRIKAGVHPFQSDIFSLGRVIQWFLDEKRVSLSEEQSLLLSQLLKEDASERPSWNGVIDIIVQILSSSEVEKINVAFRNDNSHMIIDLLAQNEPKFDISPAEGGNYLMNIVLGEFICKDVLWLKDKTKLLFNGVSSIALEDENKVQIINRLVKKLPVKFEYTPDYSSFNADITSYIDKWFRQTHSKVKNKRASRDELNFYRELLEKEKEVIAKKSLRLQFSSFKVNGDQISFTIKENLKCSSIGFIIKHADEGNEVDSDDFEYVVSANADRKQNRETVIFTGKPFEYDPDKRIFKIKDCENLKPELIPHSGYLAENTAKNEEEKNRQLDAIRKVERNEVQNPDLIYYLFKPEELPNKYVEYQPLDTVYQKDENGVPFVYSYNQEKAINNAINKRPLSVIQGPPGTGKTTVITEIVFQILAQKPDAKILITSQTNNAVDQVLENLLKNDISILRLTGIAQPKVESIRKHTLKTKIAGWKEQVHKSAFIQFGKIEKAFNQEIKSKPAHVADIVGVLLRKGEWIKRKEQIENYASRILELQTLENISTIEAEALLQIDAALGTSIADYMRKKQLHNDWLVTISSIDEASSINQKLIDSIRVIGATCNHIAAKKYKSFNFEFDYVIMDESGKATTAEAIVPIIMGENLVFVGDHRQLKPQLTNTREVESWLREKFHSDINYDSFDEYFDRASLFEDVILKIDEDYKSQLTECRRSSADQVELTSKCFYEAFDDEAIVSLGRNESMEHHLALAIDSSILFIDIGSEYKSQKDNKSNSSYNSHSAAVVADILSGLNKHDKVAAYSIGVITGYSAQSHLLRREIDKRHYKEKWRNIAKWNQREEKLTISVVDRFQGLERDIIILDLVKSGIGLDLGFLEVPNRINVALSRQKKLLILVGDYYGLINAKTPRIKGDKAALQRYLENIKEDWIVNVKQLKGLF